MRFETEAAVEMLELILLGPDGGSCSTAVIAMFEISRRAAPNQACGLHSPRRVPETTFEAPEAMREKDGQ